MRGGGEGGGVVVGRKRELENSRIWPAEWPEASITTTS